MNSLNGKILRINPDGSVAVGQPVRRQAASGATATATSQGLAFDSQGRLWEAEFGNSIMDELNLIKQGRQLRLAGLRGHVQHARRSSTRPHLGRRRRPPRAGLAIVNDSLFMAALRGERLYRMKIHGNIDGDAAGVLPGPYGRLRTVEPAPDGGLWLTTTNGDKDGSRRQATTRSCTSS